MSEFPSREALLEQFGGVSDLVKRVLTIYLQSAERYQTEIGASLQAEDMSAVAKQAHALKGSLGYFGQGDLYRTVAQLEKVAAAGDSAQARATFDEVTEMSHPFNDHLANVLEELL